MVVVPGQLGTSFRCSSWQAYPHGMALPIHACTFRLLEFESSDWQYVTMSKITP